jgi:hypothetical protein
VVPALKCDVAATLDVYWKGVFGLCDVDGGCEPLEAMFVRAHSMEVASMSVQRNDLLVCQGLRDVRGV